MTGTDPTEDSKVSRVGCIEDDDLLEGRKGGFGSRVE